MAKRKTTADLVFDVPGAICKAIQAEMTPAQRKALTSVQAAKIMTIATTTAQQVGAIIEEIKADEDGDDAKGEPGQPPDDGQPGDLDNDADNVG